MSAINRLALFGFLPFREEVEVPLANQGLVLIQGRNEVSQALSSNACGKTSLVTGLCWVLFGETLEGYKADAIINRFVPKSMTCGGRVEFAEGWVVSRTRRPGMLEVIETGARYEGKEAQEVIIERLGFGLRVFKNAVVFGQGAFERFALAEQGEQLRMLDEIQGLDLKAALKRAQDWGRKASADVQALASEQDALLLQLQGKEELLASLLRSKETFQTTKRERVAQAEQDLDAASTRLARTRESLLAAEQAEKTLPDMRQRMAQRVETSNALNKANSAILVAQRGQQAAQQAFDTFGEEEAALTQAGKCPTCRQAVSSGYVTKAFVVERKKVTSDLEAAKQEQDRATRIQQGLQKNLEKFPDLTDAIGEARASSAALPELRADIEVQTGDVSAKAKGLAEERKATWDAEDSLTHTRTMLAEIHAGMASKETALTRARTTASVADYWVEAFGDRGIRSLLFDSVADYLNARMRHHLSILTAGEATTRLSAQTALKGGGAKESISVNTEWTWGGLDRGSGGQDRRRDLALFAAMQDLAESRSSHQFPLRVYDEPFDSIDIRGQELASSWVRQQAKASGTALLITHSAEMAALANPNKVWTVALGPNGARIER